ncbi:MAG TPA: heparinase, partial [Reyranella sp.]|nr:heparinase [Reyranella sp.]
KGRNVVIEDTHDGDLAAELSLMFAVRPELGPASLTLPGLATIALEGAGRMRLEESAVTDARLRTAWPERLYRVLVPFSGRRLRLAIT